MAEWDGRSIDYLGADADKEDFETKQYEGNKGFGLGDPGTIDGGGEEVRLVPKLIRVTP